MIIQLKPALFYHMSFDEFSNALYIRIHRLSRVATWSNVQRSLIYLRKYSVFFNFCAQRENAMNANCEKISVKFNFTEFSNKQNYQMGAPHPPYTNKQMYDVHIVSKAKAYIFSLHISFEIINSVHIDDRNVKCFFFFGIFSFSCSVDVCRTFSKIVVKHIILFIWCLTTLRPHHHCWLHTHLMVFHRKSNEFTLILDDA